MADGGASSARTTRHRESLDERMHVFVAEDLERGEQNLDDDEDVEIVRWPLDELAQHLDELEDLKTVAALALFLRRR